MSLSTESIASGREARILSGAGADEIRDHKQGTISVAARDRGEV
jgi:hypothetical protein